MTPLRLTKDGPRPLARIGIIKPSALGDVVQSLPILPALRRRFPEAKFSWVIQRGLEDLVAGHPVVDDMILFDRRGGWRSWRQLITTLYQRRFDLVIDLQGLLRTGVMTAATRAPYRIGLETAREGSDWTLTHILPETGRDVPAHERYLRVVDALGADRADCRTDVSISLADRIWAERALRDLPRPIFAVHPGARWETKRWPVEQFAGVMTRAVQAWQPGIVILGSPAEQTDAELLFEKLKAISPQAAVRNLTGRTTLKQLAALLMKVDAAISNDSGPMHLAACLGTPTLGIFTCTSAVRSGPAGAQHEMVSTALACGGSYRKTCPHSGAAHQACFQELSVERVWSALQRLVRKNHIDSRRSRVA